MERFQNCDGMGSPEYYPRFDPDRQHPFDRYCNTRPVICDEFYEPCRWTSSRKPQFVWPKDKQRSFGGRLKDVFTGKGPDIFINRRGDPGPSRGEWSGNPRSGLIAQCCGINGLIETESIMPLLKSADRRLSKGHVYDFQRRKYEISGYTSQRCDRRTRQNPRRLFMHTEPKRLRG